MFVNNPKTDYADLVQFVLDQIKRDKQTCNACTGGEPLVPPTINFEELGMVPKETPLPMPPMK